MVKLAKIPKPTSNANKIYNRIYKNGWNDALKMVRAKLSSLKKR